MNNIFDIKGFAFSFGLILLVISIISCEEQTRYPQRKKTKTIENYSGTAQSRVPWPINEEVQISPKSKKPQEERLVKDNENLIHETKFGEEEKAHEEKTIHENIQEEKHNSDKEKLIFELPNPEDLQTTNHIDPEKVTEEDRTPKIEILTPESSINKVIRTEEGSPISEIVFNKEEDKEEDKEEVKDNNKGIEETPNKVVDLTLNNLSVYSSTNKEITHIDKMVHWTESLLSVEFDEKVNSLNRDKIRKITEFRDKFTEFLEENRAYFEFTNRLYNKLEEEKKKAGHIVDYYQEQKAKLYIEELYHPLEASYTYIKRAMNLIQEMLRSSYGQFLDRLESDENKIALESTDIEHLENGLRNHNNYLKAIYNKIEKSFILIETQNQSIRSHNSNSSLLSGNFINEKPPLLDEIDLREEKKSFEAYRKFSRENQEIN